MVDAAAAAQRLHDRRRAGEAYRPLVEEVGPLSLDGAYTVQDRYVALIKRERGEAVAGYKIGLTSRRMQALCGVDQPIAGVVLASGVQASPGRAVAADHIRLAIEAELAVRIGDPAARGDGRFDALAAAFELVDDAHADYARLDAPSLIADNSWNAGLVLGPLSPYAGGGLKGRAGVLRRDGAEIDRGATDDVLGDPLAVVDWLAAHLAARGGALRRGDWVTTGSIVPTKVVQAGESYSFAIEGLATVELAVG